MTAQQQVVPTSADPGAMIESVIVKGDLGKLSPVERTNYYVEVCRSVGLNPLTKPFEYIVLNGKLTLYARRDATDQLRKIHNVSVTDMTEAERDGVFVVTAKVQNADGRTDISKGAVTIKGLVGDALCNALMKAETKAKRRATLSICGLGFLDETEIETIPNAQPANGNSTRKSSAQAKRDGDWPKFMADVFDCETAVRLDALHREYRANVYPTWNKDWQDQAEAAFEDRQAELTAKDLPLTLADSLAQETVDEDGVVSTAAAVVAAVGKADYVRNCMNIIAEARDQAMLLKWWNAEKKHRIALGFTVDENADLMERVKDRAEELKANGEAVMEAGG